MKGPRGTCPACGRRISLRTDGTIRGHGGRTGYGELRQQCPGSWTRPKAVTR